MTNLTLHVFEFKSQSGCVHKIAFNRNDLQVALRNVGKLVDDKTFTWYDAARLTKQIRNIG